MPPKKDAEPEVETRAQATPRSSPLVSLGGGPYALDAAGTLYRVDSAQETVDGPEGPTLTNVAVLTKVRVRYADES